MDLSEKKEFYKELFSLAIPISLQNLALAILIPDLLMRIYTPEPALIEIGASYLRAVGVSYLLSGITQCYYLKMKIEGKASISVIISIVTLITDVVLDMFLIYGLAGVPRLGAVGSAYSTVFVGLIGLIWCVAISCRKDSIRPDWQGIKWFSPAVTKDFVKLALRVQGYFSRCRNYHRQAAWQKSL